MNVSNSGGNNSYDDVIAQLVSKVEDLEATVADQAETIDDLEDTVADQANEIKQLQDELRETKEHAGKERAELSGRISEVEAGLTDEDPTPDAGGTSTQRADLTPVEQLSRADDISEITDSPTVERAVSLFKNLDSWGSRTPKGIVLKPADNPLSLLEADRDEQLAWKQYYRAAEALEQLSEGSVTFFDSDRHGKMLVLHEQSDAYDRVVNGTLTPSSVGAEG